MGLLIFGFAIFLFIQGQWLPAIGVLFLAGFLGMGGR
jgi:hypothetical protein